GIFTELSCVAKNVVNPGTVRNIQFSDDVSTKKEVFGACCTCVLAYAIILGIVGVGYRGGIDSLHPPLAVVGVSVNAVVQQVTGRIVTPSQHAIGCVERLVEKRRS